MGAAPATRLRGVSRWLIAGYTEQRPLPAGQLAHLDAFITAREVAFALWFAGTAEVNPAFRDQLEGELAGTAESLDALLRS